MAEVRAIAVIGAGNLGRGIAHAAALGGYRTILEDILPASLRRAETQIKSSLEQAIASGHVRKEDAEAALARIEYASSIEDAARQADLVIEAVPDEFESKTEIFTLLDKVCRPQTMLVSNTVSLNIAEIAAVTYRPGKCLAMRFTDPVDEMQRLEIVGGPATDEETVRLCSEVGRRMGKDVVVITG